VTLPTLDTAARLRDWLPRHEGRAGSLDVLFSAAEPAEVFAEPIRGGRVIGLRRAGQVATGRPPAFHGSNKEAKIGSAAATHRLKRLHRPTDRANDRFVGG